LLQHYGKHEELDLLLKRLSNLQPMYADHLFKLATTMGMLQRHETAYQLFRSIVKGNFESIEPDACFYHYAAVASFNVGNLLEARRWWEKATKIDPQSEVPHFFLEQMKEWLDLNLVPTRKFKYQYVLPFSEHLRALHLYAKNQAELAQADLHYMKSSFRWAMRHDDEELKRLIIEGLALIRNDEMIRLLQEMSIDFKESESVRTFLRQSLQEYQLAPQPPWRNWPGIWGEVIETAFRSGAERYESVMLRDMEMLWTDFFQRKHESTPNLTNLNAWSAALEYVTLKMHDQPCSYSQMAERYGISKTTITNRAHWIQDTCEVTGKIHKLVEQMRELIEQQEIKR
jgi:tetratricopeptide (TPR) repeat protein